MTRSPLPAAVFTAVLLALAAALPGPARAGKATVLQCVDGAPADLIGPAATGRTLLDAGCDGGLGLRSTDPLGTKWEFDHAARVVVSAPAGTMFAGGTLSGRRADFSIHRSAGRPATWGLGYRLLAGDVEVERCGAGTYPNEATACDDGTGDVELPRFPGNDVGLPAAVSYTVEFRCATQLDACRHERSNPGVAFDGLVLEVVDEADPVVESVSGALADPTAVVRSNALTVDARDDGLGVLAVRVFADEHLVHTQPFPGTACAPVPGAGDGLRYRAGRPCEIDPGPQTFAVANLPEGGPQRVRAVVLDATGNERVAFDHPSVTVDAVPPPSALGTPPGVSGTLRDGESVVASTGDWNGHGRAMSYAYQWERCNAGGAGCAAIPDRRSRNYLLEAGDVGRTIRVAVTATSDEGSAVARSAAVGPVVARGAAAPVAAMPVPSSSADAEAVNGLGATRAARLTAGVGATRRRAVRVPYGRRVVVVGRLDAGSTGAPITGAALDVLSRVRKPGSSVFKLVSVTRTAKDGTFWVEIPAGVSRTIRIGYRASARDRDYAVLEDLLLTVTARPSLFGPETARRGGGVRVTGRVPEGAGGEMTLQVAKGRGPFRTVAVADVVDGGRYTARLRVPRTRAKSIRVRARYAPGPAVPLGPGTSPAETIRLR